MPPAAVFVGATRIHRMHATEENVYETGTVARAGFAVDNQANELELETMTAKKDAYIARLRRAQDQAVELYEMELSQEGDYETGDVARAGFSTDNRELDVAAALAVRSSHPARVFRACPVPSWLVEVDESSSCQFDSKLFLHFRQLLHRTSTVSTTKMRRMTTTTTIPLKKSRLTAEYPYNNNIKYTGLGMIESYNRQQSASGASLPAATACVRCRWWFTWVGP